MSRKKIILDLLQLSKNREEDVIENIIEQRNLSPQKFRETIQDLNKSLKNIITIKEDLIHVPKKSRIDLVNIAVKLGTDLDKIVETLHWKEFEDFCLRVLEHHEFSALQNYYFTYRKKRHEIDVIGMRNPIIFAIDAKKWKTGRSSGLKSMVKNQIIRVKAFSRSLETRDVRRNLNLTNWKRAKLIPMIVTSKMYEIKIFESVPIVPFFKLNGFITDYYRYSEMILKFLVKFSSQKTLCIQE